MNKEQKKKKTYCSHTQLCILSLPHTVTTAYTTLGALPASGTLSHLPTFSSSALSTTTHPAAAIATAGCTTPATSAKGSVSLPAFVLASAIPPIPGKTVQRIQAGEYVDMRHLLPDNVTLLDKLEGMPQSLLAPRPRLREITSLHTWTSCLLRMIAIQAATDPGRVVEMCAYGCLIIREACTHGGEGWVAYDTLFRQHAAARPGTSWASLDPSIHAATFVAMRSGTGVLCRHCSGSDHQSGHCALAPLHTPLPLSPPTNTHVPSQWPTQRRSDYRSSTSMTAPPRICNSWNRGKCLYGTACSYRHICATCKEAPAHRAKDCDQTPPDSIFRRPYPLLPHPKGSPRGNIGAANSSTSY